MNELVNLGGVLNLIINGLPSKLEEKYQHYINDEEYDVLNLIINGLPSKLNRQQFNKFYFRLVLNLIINGLPSKHNGR